MKKIKTFKRTIFSVCLLLAIFTSCLFAEQNRFDEERKKMVQDQIIDRGITDKRVIDALKKVPRHLFVRPDFLDFSYTDSPLPISHGQTISQPYMVALMTQLLGLKGDEKVLEIGTGSGYQTAVLAEVAGKVYSIEIIKFLADSSRKLLKELGYESIEILWADGYKGWPEYAPYDAIIVTCAPGGLPQSLVDQLAEGGRMVIPIGDRDAGQQLLLLRKIKGKLQRQYITDVRFVPMTDNLR